MTIYQVLRVVCSTILMKWLGHSSMSSMKLPLLKAVGGTANHCTPGVGHGPSPGGAYACQVYTQMGCSDANHNELSPLC